MLQPRLIFYTNLIKCSRNWCHFITQLLCWFFLDENHSQHSFIIIFIIIMLPLKIQKWLLCLQHPTQHKAILNKRKQRHKAPFSELMILSRLLRLRPRDGGDIIFGQGLQELCLLLNDNYHGSWGASIFYNLVVCEHISVYGRPTTTHTHTHTQVESGGRTAHTDLILSDKTLWGVQRERGRWRKRERDMEKEGWERRFRGLFCQPTTIKWKQELSV